jgi:hypothetical protein
VKISKPMEGSDSGTSGAGIEFLKQGVHRRFLNLLEGRSLRTGFRGTTRRLGREPNYRGDRGGAIRCSWEVLKKPIFADDHIWI